MAELKAVITKVKQERVLDGNYIQLAVHFDIMDGEDVLASRVHGFGAEATEEQIGEAIKKELATYQNDKLVGEQAAQAEALQNKAAETAERLSGKEIA